MLKTAILEVYTKKKIDLKKRIDAHLRNSILIGEYIGADVLIVENYVVNGYSDLIKKIELSNKDFEKHLKIQMSWRKNELSLKMNVLEKLKEIFTK